MMHRYNMDMVGTRHEYAKDMDFIHKKKYRIW